MEQCPTHRQTLSLSLSLSLSQAILLLLLLLSPSLQNCVRNFGNPSHTHSLSLSSVWALTPTHVLASCLPFSRVYLEAISPHATFNLTTTPPTPPLLSASYTIVCEETSVTRWLDYFATFGHLLERKYAQWHTKLANVVPKLVPISKNSPKIAQDYRFCQSGEISSNLVTMEETKTSSNPPLLLCSKRFSRISELLQYTHYTYFVVSTKTQKLFSNSRKREWRIHDDRE